MKKIISLCISAVFLTQMLMAQFESFDLKKYKLPEIKRKQLDLSVYLNESSQGENTKSELQDKYYEKNSSFWGNTWVSYSSYTNSARRQSSQSISLSLTPDFQSHTNRDKQETRNSQFRSTLSISNINRIYFKNNFFFEPDLIFSGGLGFNKSKSDPDIMNIKGDEAFMLISAPLRTGKGRIEPIQDARLAIYILDELNKKGSLARIPDENEILQFAALISRLKNERFFDSRIKRMYEIEKVDSFLQETGMASVSDAKYFTTITDNWDYASGPLRENGNRFSVGIVPAIDFNNFFSKRTGETEVDKDHRQVYSIGTSLEMDFFSSKPLNLKWQRTWHLGLAYLFDKRVYKELRPDDDEYNFMNKNINGEITYRLEYFANSRTRVRGQFSFDFNRMKRDNNYSSYTSKYIFVNVNPNLLLAINYYISPQLRFILQYDATYHFGHDNYKEELYQEYIYTKRYGLLQSMQASFTYSIF